MSDAYVRTIDTVTDFDGCEVAIGVDYDTVTVNGVGTIRLDRVQAEEFARAFTSACWMAGQQAHLHDDPPWPSIDPDCVAGKHGSCAGGPCECECHQARAPEVTR